jgi:hypothetical protein
MGKEYGLKIEGNKGTNDIRELILNFKRATSISKIIGL